MELNSNVVYHEDLKKVLYLCKCGDWIDIYDAVVNRFVFPPRLSCRKCVNTEFLVNPGPERKIINENTRDNL
tara:strand:- start:16308 stop:16523 length:216 start_codon:yes stop_codon:yes gene_type:complete